MNNIVSMKNTELREVEVNEIQWDRIPASIKDEVLVCVFRLLCEQDDSEDLNDLSDVIGDLSKAFSPIYNSQYSIKKTVLVDSNGLKVSP